MSVSYGSLKYAAKESFDSMEGGIFAAVVAAEESDYAGAFVNAAALQVAIDASGYGGDQSLGPALASLGFLITSNEAAAPSDKARYAEYADVIAVRNDAEEPSKRWTLYSQFPSIKVTCDDMFSPASQVFTVVDEPENSQLYSAARFASIAPPSRPLFWQRRVLAAEEA
jgi:hypothetical protein